MKGKILWGFTIVIIFTLAMAIRSWSAVPPPPVNQLLGIPDSVFYLYFAIIKIVDKKPGELPPLMR